MTDKDKDIEFRNKIVEWLKSNNWYAVLHDGHWSRYVHVRTLDETCKGLTNEIYGAFLESYACEYADKGKPVVDSKLSLDGEFSWEWLYRRFVLKEAIPEVRRCKVCGKDLTDKEYYTCAEHTKPLNF